MKKIINLLYNSSVYLILSLTILVILTSICWLLNISMSCFHFPISLIISAIILLKKDKKMVVPIIVALLIIILSVLIAGHVYDQSDDGNSYHKETIGMIKNGCNPIYDNYEKFALDHDFKSKHSMWAVHYPKTTWIIGSSVYKITNNIETSKFYNYLICFIGIGILSKLLLSIVKNRYLAFIIAVMAVLNPIMMSQIFSFYLDGFMGILLFIVIIQMYHYVKGNCDDKLRLCLGCAIILIINCKFTGLAYAFIFCIGYYLYYLYFKIKNKDFTKIKNSIIYFFVTVFIGIVVVGSNSYITNIVNNKSMFYPLMGKNKVDIMTYLQPASFKKMSPIKKNYYSIFSKTANIGVFNSGEPQLKVPFTYDDYEIHNINYDTRIGGYGVYFSGIFLISIVIICVGIIILLIKKEYENLILLTIPILFITMLLFFLSDGWWARYAPYLYLIVLFASILLACKKNIIFRGLFCLFTIIVLLNSYKCFISIYKRDIPISGATRINLDKLSGNNISVYLNGERFTGILYNLDDHNINYKIVSKKSDTMKSLYGSFVYYE